MLNLSNSENLFAQGLHHHKERKPIHHQVHPTMGHHRLPLKIDDSSDLIPQTPLKVTTPVFIHQNIEHGVQEHSLKTPNNPELNHFSFRKPRMERVYEAFTPAGARLVTEPFQHGPAMKMAAIPRL